MIYDPRSRSLLVTTVAQSMKTRAAMALWASALCMYAPLSLKPDTHLANQPHLTSQPR